MGLKLSTNIKLLIQDRVLPKPPSCMYKNSQSWRFLLIEHNKISSKMAVKVIFSDLPGNVELGEPEKSLFI